MVMQNFHQALDRDAILRALSSFYGITTADGNIGGTTLFCSALIGSNDFITDKTILLESGLAIFEDSGATAFNPVNGQITVNPAFNSRVLAGTAFYVLNTISPAIAALVMAFITSFSGNRPLVSLYEGWQDGVIDAAVWTITDPVAGAAWATGAIAEDLMVYCTPAVNRNARLRSNSRWIVAPDRYAPNKILRRFILEFEAHFIDFANFDPANFILGLTTAIGDTRANNNIIGFALVAPGNALQTVTDVGGAFVVNTGFLETLTNTNKFRIEVSLDSVAFYLNEVLIATHIINLPSNWPMYLNFYTPTGGGGPATPRFGIIRSWVEDVAR